MEIAPQMSKCSKTLYQIDLFRGIEVGVFFPGSCSGYGATVFNPITLREHWVN